MSKALSAITFMILTHPAVYKELQEELSKTFSCIDDITFDSASKLPYLRAIIDEGQRIHPVAPIGGIRESPGGYVDGIYVPLGVCAQAGSRWQSFPQ